MPKARQQEPKLKTSCNNCSSAKVRCEKDTDASVDSPTCQRCTQQNLECVYGVSQRKGKPFQPYPKSKPANVAQNVDNGEGQQNPDNNNNPNCNPQRNNNKSNTTNTDNTYPWPKTGWNLSDVGPEIDFSFVSQNPSDDIELTLPQTHDMCTVMSNLRSHLSALEKLLDSTYGSDISNNVADQYLTELRTIRATIQQLLSCKCHTCHHDTVIVFLLATLGSSLSESYRRIVVNLLTALGAAIDNNTKPIHLTTFASSLQLEIARFRVICHLIREKASRHPEAKAVGEAFYKMLCGQVKSSSDFLDIFIANLARHLNRLQNPFPVSC
jgi:hypothetical protein